MLGALACRQALGREIYFCLDGPTGPSVSIKGPESSPDHLTFVRKDLGNGRKEELTAHESCLAPQCSPPCLCKVWQPNGRAGPWGRGPILGEIAELVRTPPPEHLQTSFPSPGPQKNICSRPRGPQRAAQPAASQPEDYTLKPMVAQSCSSY